MQTRKHYEPANNTSFTSENAHTGDQLGTQDNMNDTTNQRVHPSHSESSSRSGRSSSTSSSHYNNNNNSSASSSVITSDDDNDSNQHFAGRRQTLKEIRGRKRNNENQKKRNTLNKDNNANNHKGGDGNENNNNSNNNNNNSGGGGNTKPKKQTIKRRLNQFGKRVLPQGVYEYGQTVYGGNPVAQQTLPGWFAYPSPFVMIPLFFIIMIPFIVVGILIIIDSQDVYVFEQEYSNISKYQYAPKDPSVNINQGIKSITFEGQTYTQGTRTWMEFTIEKKLKAPVFFYYTLHNYFQNHRDFHDGRNILQIKGDKSIGSTSLCRPFRHPLDFSDEELAKENFVTITKPDGSVVQRSFKDMTYNPCGLAPWSQFNDTIHLYKVVSTEAYNADPTAYTLGGAAGTTPLQSLCNGSDFALDGTPLGASASSSCRKKGISMKADSNVRFKPITPREDWWSLRYPYPTDNPYLNAGYYHNEPGHSMPDPEDLDLQVWLRSALLNHFKKLYRILDVDLEPGPYMVEVEEYYDTVSFNGKKGIAFRDRHWVGEDNTALGILFVIMGACCFVLGVTFTTEYCLKRKGMDRLRYMKQPKRSWYLFDKSSPLMEAYYQKRMERYVPFAQLEALRKLDSDTEEGDEEDREGRGRREVH